MSVIDDIEDFENLPDTVITVGPMPEKSTRVPKIPMWGVGGFDMASGVTDDMLGESTLTVEKMRDVMRLGRSRERHVDELNVSKNVDYSGIRHNPDIIKHVKCSLLDRLSKHLIDKDYIDTNFKLDIRFYELKDDASMRLKLLIKCYVYRL